MNHQIASAMANSGPAAPSNQLVGYRFHPTDDELLTHFLKPKLLPPADYRPPILEVKVCDYEPWILPDLIDPNSNDQVWYFFCPRDYKYLRSLRSNRTTKSGYWKPTGKPRKVLNKRRQEIGTKKSLVFYIRERPKPIRTKWTMHEYECALNSTMATLGSFVLCKLKSKAEEMASEDQLVHMDSESDLDSQNLHDMTVNSSCDEQQSDIINICFDFNNCNKSDTTHVSNYEKDKPSGFDSENQNSNEVTTNSGGNEDEVCYYLGSDIRNENSNDMAAMSTSVNDKLNCCKRDFECQNPSQITDISITQEGKWSPCGSTPSGTSLSPSSTNTNVNLEEMDLLLNCINEQEFEELDGLVPNESTSYSSFCAGGHEDEIEWENLFSLFT